MLVSMATATFYRLPFPKALEIIRAAGFEYIELDGYWAGGRWEIAQHLKGIPPRDVLAMVRDSGLRISSFHDMGGVIEAGHEGIVSPATHEYLENADIPCLVLHTPHKMTGDPNWWSVYREVALNDLRALSNGRLVLVENLTPIEGYIVPLIAPEDMRAFAEEGGIHVNLDVTHAAHAGIDILYAADILGPRIRALHLSDYSNGRMHVYVGDGVLPLREFFARLDASELYAATIECDIPYAGENDELSIEKCRRVKAFVEEVTGI